MIVQDDSVTTRDADRFNGRQGEETSRDKQ